MKVKKKSFLRDIEIFSYCTLFHCIKNPLLTISLEFNKYPIRYTSQDAHITVHEDYTQNITHSYRCLKLGIHVQLRGRVLSKFQNSNTVTQNSHSKVQKA